jgi:hypothetical protein
VQLLVRLDDFTPNRPRDRWSRVEAMLGRLSIRPLVAVVPQDRYFGAQVSDDSFWEDVRGLAARDWTIGLHGLTHEVVPIPADARREIFYATKSEFVGLPFEQQLQRISTAWNLFAAQGIEPDVFVAPNHGFDANTVDAVRRHGRMRYIADGIALRPFLDRGLGWLPQLDWRVPRIGFGFRTVCLHPSTISECEFRRVERDLARRRDEVVDVCDLDPTQFRAHGAGSKFFAASFAVYFWLRESSARLLVPASAKRQERAGP